MPNVIAAAMLVTMDRLEVPQGAFDLSRWPRRGRSNLRAWDAADEYVLHHLAEQAPTGDRWVIVNDGSGALACGLHEQAPISMGDSWIAHEASRRNLQANDLPTDLITTPGLHPIAGEVDVVVIKVPKTLALLEDQLHRLRPAVRAGATVIGAGMTRHVHTSTLDTFERLLGPTTTSLARKKARLIHVTADPSLDPGPNPYPTSFELETGETVINHANVFSRDRLDVGTRLLLDHLPTDVAGPVVDLGCGSGIVSLRLAAENPEAELVLRDDSYQAVASAEATLAAAGLTEGADIAVGDGTTDLADASVAAVVSNPPFHQDHAVGDEVAWSMFKDAHRVLRPGGELRIVGNRHLAYHAKVKRIFGNVATVASTPKFVVLSAHRRRS